MEYEQVFISYHTSSSAETVHKICEILEERGISCWYAPRNVTGDYATAIVNAIDRCSVFLVILNEKSNLSEDVCNEINCAFERVRRHENMTILPFRIDESALSAAVKYYLGRIHIMNGSVPPEIARIHELADRISVLLDKFPQKNGALSDERNQIKQYAITGTIVYADKNFVGREKELEALHLALCGNTNKTFLVGMGGIGKSEIAKTYCTRFREEYDVILWVPFNGSLEKTLCNDFDFPIQGIERNNYPDDTDRGYFIRKLEILKQISNNRVLLVIDNFDVTDDPDLEIFCNGKYSVIFTTRCRDISSRIPSIEVLQITDPNELAELFCTEYKRLGISSDDITELVTFLDGHPLSIRLVASIMQSNRRLNATTMLELLTSRGIQSDINSNSKATDLILERLHTVFRLSDMSDESVAVLNVLSLIPLIGITVEELFDWCGWTDYEIIDDLIQKSWIIHNPVSDEVHLHPIIAKMCREELQADASCCDSYIGKLIELANVTKDYSWQRIQQLTKYCESACEYLPENYPLKQQLLVATGSIFIDVSRFNDSIKLFGGLLQSASDAETKLFMYHKLSHVQVLSGDAESGMETAEKGYAFLQTLDMEQLSLSGKYMKKVLLQRIGEASREIGNYEKAVEYGNKAVAACDEYNFDNPELSKGWALYHLARSLICTGQLSEAQIALNEASSLFEKMSDKWSLAFCYLLLSRINYLMKRYDMAMQYVTDAWDIHIPHYGESGKAAATLFVEKGNILSAQCKHKEALECFEKAAEIYRNLNLVDKEKNVSALIAEVRSK